MDGTKVGHAIHSRVAAGEQVTTTETVNMTINRMGKAVTHENKGDLR